MSRDIRSFFKALPSKETQPKQNGSKLSLTKSNKTGRKRPLVVESDSDNEIEEKPSKKAQKTEIKDVSAVFGTVPAARSKSRSVSSAKIASKIKEPDVDMHSDDDFEATVAQLDAQDALRKQQYVPEVNVKKQDESRKDKISPNPKTGKKKEQFTKSDDVRKETDLKIENTPKKRKVLEENIITTPTQTKVKESSESPFVTPEDKKRKNAQAYAKFLNREGPKNLGSKEIPEGAPDFLKGKVFVITGVLDSIERDEAANIVKKYSGKVTSSVSRNTSYILCGRDAGESKLSKARQHGTTILSEDEFLDLIRNSNTGKKTNTEKKISPNKEKKISPNKEKKTSPNKEKNHAIENSEKNIAKTGKASTVSRGNNCKTKESMHNNEKITSSKKVVEADVPKKVLPKKEDSFRSTVQLEKKGTSHPRSKDLNNSDEQIAGSSKQSSVNSKGNSGAGSSLMWVDKHAPKSTKQIIGQHGDRSPMNKLKQWLLHWHVNAFKPSKRPSPFGSDDGSGLKAALLSGPPGIGKTTTARLVAEELEFSVVEFNASDSRSKKCIQGRIADLLGSKSIVGQTVSKKHLLLMEEVDGMAGNEDRGGMQELIQALKKSKVPIICTCNNRAHPKVRSLSNYCYDLRFSKPRVEQIKAAMMSVCFKEGLKIKADALNELILSSNQDMRQILHHLSLWNASNKEIDSESGKSEAQKAKKDLKLGPWDVIRKVFSHEDHKNMSIHDKVGLFFHDYSLAPLFVQDSYLNVIPAAAKYDKQKTLDLMSQAADSICDGDICDSLIRSGNNWSMLPVQAMFSSVIPGDILSGHMSGQIEFPAWFGKNSKRNRIDRVLQEVHSHLRLNITGGKSDLNRDYAQYLRNAVYASVVKNQEEGISDAVDVMAHYSLARDDLEILNEISLWPGFPDMSTKLQGKVKAAFTRLYNKRVIQLPYALGAPVPKRVKTSVDYGDEEEMDDVEEEKEQTAEKDAMIKVKTSKKTTKATKGPAKGKKGGGKK